MARRFVGHCGSIGRCARGATNTRTCLRGARNAARLARPAAGREFGSEARLNRRWSQRRVDWCLLSETKVLFGFWKPADSACNLCGLSVFVTLKGLLLFPVEAELGASLDFGVEFVDVVSV